MLTISAFLSCMEPVLKEIEFILTSYHSITSKDSMTLKQIHKGFNLINIL
jgi:hypothetical protein